MKSMNQLVYETLGNQIEEVMEITGLDWKGAATRRAAITEFLDEHEWDDTAFALWSAKWAVDGYPAKTTLAKNFLTATMEHLRTGWHRCSDEEAEARFAKCLECEELRDGARCMICGCYMKLKSTWQEQRCPIGKW